MNVVIRLIVRVSAIASLNGTINLNDVCIKITRKSSGELNFSDFYLYRSQFSINGITSGSAGVKIELVFTVSVCCLDLVFSVCALTMIPVGLFT